MTDIGISPDKQKEKYDRDKCEPIETNFPASDGFVITGEYKSSNVEKEVSKLVYCLPSEKRLVKNKYALHMSYDTILAKARVTYIHPLQNITTEFSFNGNNTNLPHKYGNHPSKYGVKIKHWPEVDRQLYDYFSDMFIDLPKGQLL